MATSIAVPGGLKDKQDDLVIAAQNLAVLACVHGQGTIPTVITTDVAGNLLPLPANWFALGELDQKAGAKISPEIKTTDIYGYGSLVPRRTFKTEESVTVSFTAQESRKVNLELFWSADLSNTEPDENGEWQFIKSAAASLTYYSLLLIGEDYNSSGAVLPYWIFPKVAVTKTEAINLMQDGPLAYPFTFQAFEDADFGGYVGVGSAGAGQAAINTLAGFTAGS